MAGTLELIFAAFRETGSRILKFRPSAGVPPTAGEHLEPIHTLYRDSTTGVMKTRGPSFTATGAKDAFGRDIVKTAIGTLFREKETGILKARVPVGAPECVCTVCTEPDIFIEDFYDKVKVTLPQDETCAADGVVDHTGTGDGIVHRCMTVSLAGVTSPCSCMNRFYGPLQRTTCRPDRIDLGIFEEYVLPGRIPGDCVTQGVGRFVCGGPGPPRGEVLALECESCTHCSDPANPIDLVDGPRICAWECKFTKTVSPDPSPGTCRFYLSALGSNGLHCWDGGANRYFPGCPGLKYVGCTPQTVEADVGATPGGADLTRRLREQNFGCLDEIVDQGLDSCITSKDETRQKRFVWSFEKGEGVSSCNGCTECSRGVSIRSGGLGNTGVETSCVDVPPLCEDLESSTNHLLTMFVVTHCQREASAADSDSCSNGHIWAHVQILVTYLDYTGDTSESPHNCDGTGNLPPEEIVPCPDPCSELDSVGADQGSWNNPGGACLAKDVGTNFTQQVNRFSTDCSGKAISLSNSVIPRPEICAPGKPASQGGRVLSLFSQEPYHWSGGVYPPGAGDTYLGPILTLTLFAPDESDTCEITVDGQPLLISCPGYSLTPTP